MKNAFQFHHKNWLIFLSNNHTNKKRLGVSIKKKLKKHLTWTLKHSLQLKCKTNEFYFEILFTKQYITYITCCTVVKFFKTFLILNINFDKVHFL